MDEAGDRSRPFNGMNIDDVLQGFNIDSEDHDGITDPLNTSADITGGTFDDDVSFGWFLRDPPSTPGPDDSVDDSVSQDTQEEEEHVPGPSMCTNLLYYPLIMSQFFAVVNYNLHHFQTQR